MLKIGKYEREMLEAVGAAVPDVPVRTAPIRTAPVGPAVSARPVQPVQPAQPISIAKPKKRPGMTAADMQREITARYGLGCMVYYRHGIRSGTGRITRIGSTGLSVEPVTPPPFYGGDQVTIGYIDMVNAKENGIFLKRMDAPGAEAAFKEATGRPIKQAAYEEEDNEEED